MNLLLTMIRQEVRLALRRPLFWIALILSLAFTVGYFLGGVQVNPGTGGLAEEEKVHVNGPYQLAIFYMAIPFIVYTMFAALAMATSVVRDEECKVEDVLRSTHLGRRQYIIGKFLGTGTWVIGILVFGLFTAILCDAITAGIAADGGMNDPRVYGTFDLVYHLYPFVCFTLPWFFFAMTASFYLGEKTRSPLVIFASLGLLYAFVLVFSDFSTQALERWCQDTLNLEWSTLRAWIDPSGLSWITEIYANEDRGVRFYNSEIPTLDLPYTINRLAFLFLGLFCLWRTIARCGKSRHGSLKALESSGSRKKKSERKALSEQDLTLPEPFHYSRTRGGSAGWFRILQTELRLLRRQPSLWVFAPLILLFSIPAVFFIPGPWEAKVIVTASPAAYSLAVTLAPWICAYGACLMIEVMNRERATGFRDVFLSSAVRTRSIVFAKVTAVFLTMTALVAIGAAVTGGIQVGWHKTPLQPEVYAQVLGVLLLPGLLFFLVLAAFFSSITQGRGSAYGLLIGFGLLYVVGLFTSWLDWRGKVIPTSLVVASDISGLRPYLRELTLNRTLVLSTTLALFLLAVYLYPRTDAPRLPRLSVRALRSRKLGFVFFVLFTATALTCGVLLDRSMDQGPDAEWREDRIDEYVLRNRVKWGSPDQKLPEYQALDLKVAFQPSERTFEVDGLFTIGNRTDETFRSLPLTMSLDFEIEPEGHIYYVETGEDGAPQEIEAQVSDRNGLYEIALPTPLPPGGQTTLRMRYAGILNPGSKKTNGGFQEWILEDAIFVDSFGSTFLPTVGYIDPESPNQDTSDSRMTPEELALHFDGFHPAAFGGYGTFDVKVEIDVPEGLTALSTGKLVGTDTVDGRSRFRYESEHPVYFFPILAGRYEVAEREGCTVYYVKGHEHNVETILETLVRSRKFYSALFSPYPFESLRLVEFPRFAGFAMGHPSIIPFSEALGFLTEGDDGISNINFMVTAHEVAHQWWGTVITPADVPGAPFLTEALAHYSTLLMEERFNGRVACRNRRLEFERLYVESRTPDVERPIVLIDGSEASDQPLWYNKGGMVFWMVSETLGRERLIAALRSFIGEFGFEKDHPTIFDLYHHIQAQAPPEHEPFLRQWFYEVVLPKPEVLATNVTTADGGFLTTANIKNSGTGTIDLVVEVSNRRRLTTEVGIESAPVPFPYDQLPDPFGWDEELKPDEGTNAENGSESDIDSLVDSRTEEKPELPYEAVRITVTLGPGEEKEVRVETSFSPQHILLDPDADFLIGGRQLAKKDLDADASEG